MGSLAGLAGPLGLDPADRVGGGPADGAGVVAAQLDGDGVQGLGASTGAGVHGLSGDPGGLGVKAENTGGGNALQVLGPALFSRSGFVIIQLGMKSAKVTGVGVSHFGPAPLH